MVITSDDEGDDSASAPVVVASSTEAVEGGLVSGTGVEPMKLSSKEGEFDSALFGGGEFGIPADFGVILPTHADADALFNKLAAEGMDVSLDGTGNSSMPGTGDLPDFNTLFAVHADETDAQTLAMENPTLTNVGPFPPGPAPQVDGAGLGEAQTPGDFWSTETVNDAENDDNSDDSMGVFFEEWAFSGPPGGGGTGSDLNLGEGQFNPDAVTNPLNLPDPEVLGTPADFEMFLASGAGTDELFASLAAEGVNVSVGGDDSTSATGEWLDLDTVFPVGPPLFAVQADETDTRTPEMDNPTHSNREFLPHSSFENVPTAQQIANVLKSPFPPKDTQPPQDRHTPDHPTPLPGSNIDATFTQWLHDDFDTVNSPDGIPNLDNQAAPLNETEQLYTSFLSCTEICGVPDARVTVLAKENHQHHGSTP
ncbi:hypothetical protein [Streptomyces sp. NPDC000410]|uniref:hypothetical protein n=1 Tax=Streptomyces sp. NPDC000410 TaxID=3154254 RepID=UPI0033233649